MAPSSWILVLSGGGVCSLTAAATISERSRLALAFVLDGAAGEEPRREAFAQQADHLGVRRRFELPLSHASRPSQQRVLEPAMTPQRVLPAVQLLAAAVELAGQVGAVRLVWPVQVGEDEKAASRVIEAMQLAQEANRIDTGEDFRIDVPLLEMTGRQVVEVGHQLDLPWEMARSCLTDRPEPCGGCDGCNARATAFKEAGLEDPLTSTRS